MTISMRLLSILLLLAITSVARADDLSMLRAHDWVLESIEFVGSHRAMPIPGSEPTLRFAATVDDLDATRFELIADGQCNEGGGSYVPAGPGRIDMSASSRTLVFCGFGILEYESVYYVQLSRMKNFAVTDTTLRLWDADSTTIMRFALEPSVDLGARVQIINLLTGVPGIDLFTAETIAPALRVDSFPRSSTAPWLGPETRRFAFSARNAGFAARFFDTTIAPPDSVSLLFVVYRDASGDPAVRVLERMRAPSHDRAQALRLMHASSTLGPVAMRLVGHGAAPIVEGREMVAGSVTPAGIAEEQGMRLHIARLGATTTESFVIPYSTALHSARTLIVGGSPETGDLRVFAVYDDPLTRPDVLVQAPRAPFGANARFVNLDARPVSITTQNLPMRSLAPMTVSQVDDYNALEKMIVETSVGDSLRYTIRNDPGTTNTIFRAVRGSGAQTVEIVSPASVAVHPDSARLRVVGLLGNRRYRVEIPAAGVSMEIDDAVTPTVTLPAGETRVIVSIEGAVQDTAFALIDMRLARGSTSTLVLLIEGHGAEARLLVDSDPRAHALQRLDVRAVAPPPPVAPPAGRIALANLATRGVMAATVDDTTSLSVPDGFVLRSPLRTPGLRGTPVTIGTATLAPDFTIVDDTTTTFIVIGDGGAWPYTTITLRAPIERAPNDTAAALRIVNAMDGIDAVDINGVPQPFMVPERRVFRNEATEHLPALVGPVRVDVFHKAGHLFYSAIDTLRSEHRYTMVLTGTVTAPRVQMFDDDADGLARMTRATIVMPPVASVETGVAPPRVTVSNGRIVVADRSITRVMVVDMLGRSVAYAIDGTAAIDGVVAGAYYVAGVSEGGVVWSEGIVVR